MPRAELTVENVDAVGLEPTANTGDAANDHLFDAGDRVIIRVENGTGMACTVGIVTPKTIEGLAIADAGASVPDGEVRYFGPFPANLYAQPSGADAGKVYLDVDQAVDIEVIRVP